MSLIADSLHSLSILSRHRRASQDLIKMRNSSLSVNATSPHYFRTLPFHLKYLHVGLLSTYLLLGLWLKAIIFRFLREHSRCRSVDRLVGTDQRVSSLTALILVTEIAVLVLPCPLQDWLGSDYCVLLSWVGLFGFAYMCFGGCGIALYR